MIGRPVIFGEVLFDVFPDGRRVLGGAPFNVAWHLQAFGSPPLMISRIGDDDAGQEVLKTMSAWGMDRRGIQIDNSFPTGTVRVRLEDGNPSFEIESDQAYDHIEWESLRTALPLQDLSMVYHGTLALRNDTSKTTFDELTRTTKLGLFFDVNLRAPWWERGHVRQRLERARWVKMNQAELAIVTGQPTRTLDECRLAEGHLPTSNAECVFITAGGDGSIARFNQHPFQQAISTGSTIIDTVGAGDASAAVTMLGLLRDWEPQVTLERASLFAADICGIPGATTTDPMIYRRHTQAWNRE